MHKAMYIKQTLLHLSAAIFFALLGAVYELFSHEVYSYYMLYAFAIPLLMGVLPYAILLLKEKYPGKMFLNLWNTATATLSIGSVFAGVLAIYGTTNSLIIVYPIAGGILILISLAFLLFKDRAKAKSGECHDCTA